MTFYRNPRFTVFTLPSLTMEQAVVSDVYNIPRRVSVIYIGIYIPAFIKQWHPGGTFAAPFSNMRTLKFKAQPTNAFFATVKQMFGGSSQLPTTAESCSYHETFYSRNPVQAYPNRKKMKMIIAILIYLFDSIILFSNNE